MGAKILVIDDEESIRFSFEKFLSSGGYTVTTAESCAEALAKMDESDFDLILVDMILDDGWGIDILQAVMNRKLKTRVIVMTAYPGAETAETSFRLHALYYLAKPLGQKKLLHFVNSALMKPDQKKDDCVRRGRILPSRTAGPLPVSDDNTDENRS